MHPLTAKVQLSAANFDSKPKAPAQQTPVKVSSKKPKVKKISFGLMISIAVVVIIFLAYYFVPEISLRIASFQTGIDPSYPSYTPANTFLYQNPSTVKGNLTILPCDNGLFTPNFDLLRTGTEPDLSPPASGTLTDNLCLTQGFLDTILSA